MYSCLLHVYIARAFSVRDFHQKGNGLLLRAITDSGRWQSTVGCV